MSVVPSFSRWSLLCLPWRDHHRFVLSAAVFERSIQVTTPSFPLSSLCLCLSDPRLCDREALESVCPSCTSLPHTSTDSTSPRLALARTRLQKFPLVSSLISSLCGHSSHLPQINLTKLIGTEKEVKKLLSQWKLSCSPLCELLVVQLAANDRTLLNTLTGQCASFSLLFISLALSFGELSDHLAVSCHQHFVFWTATEAEERSKLIFEQWKEMT
jgi:hypothetical protein